MSNPHPLKENQWKPGQSGNPSGRPKNTLKDFTRQMLAEMTDEQKLAWLKEHNISGDTIWKMAEGNPETKSDITLKDESKNLSPEALKLAKEYEEKLKKGM